MLALVIPAAVNAQKIKSINYDAATGDTVVLTSTEKIARIGNLLSVTTLRAYATRERGTVTLYLELSKVGGKSFSLSSDINVVFTLGDYTIVDLPNLNDDETARRIHISLHNDWVNAAVVDIANKTIAQMSAKSVRIIRIQADERNFDFNLKLDESKKLCRILALALNGRHAEKKSL